MQFGIQTQHGIDMAVDEINRAGGVNGVPLRVVVRDDRSAGAEAARVAGEFVANPRVVAVIGHPGSAAEVAAARVYDAGHLPALATTPSSPDLSGISPWVFRMISSDSVNGAKLAEFASSLASSLHRPVRAGVLYRNDAYGRGLADAFLRSFQGQVINTDPIDPDSDLEPYMAFYRQTAPDIVVVASEQELGVRVLHAASRAGLRASFLGGDGWQGITPDTSVGAIYIGAPFSTRGASPNIQKFVTSYVTRFGSEPDANAALAYDATRLIASAIRRNGPDRVAIRRYLSSLSRENPYVALTGPMWFAPNNDPAATSFVVAPLVNSPRVPAHAP